MQSRKPTHNGNYQSKVKLKSFVSFKLVVTAGGRCIEKCTQLKTTYDHSTMQKHSGLKEAVVSVLRAAGTI